MNYGRTRTLNLNDLDLHLNNNQKKFSYNIQYAAANIFRYWSIGGILKKDLLDIKRALARSESLTNWMVKETYFTWDWFEIHPCANTFFICIPNPLKNSDSLGGYVWKMWVKRNKQKQSNASSSFCGWNFFPIWLCLWGVPKNISCQELAREL